MQAQRVVPCGRVGGAAWEKTGGWVGAGGVGAGTRSRPWRAHPPALRVSCRPLVRAGVRVVVGVARVVAGVARVARDGA